MDLRCVEEPTRCRGTQHKATQFDPCACTQTSQKVALPMNSNDRLYAEIRHMNITAVGPLLQGKARELQQTYAGRHNMNQISEIRKFVKKIPGMQQATKSLHQFIAFTEVLVKVSNDDKFVEKWQIERGEACPAGVAACWDHNGCDRWCHVWSE